MTSSARPTLQVRLSEDFLYAGSSALLISIAHSQPEAWYFSLFALVPFLWRAIRVGICEAALLGALLGASYVLASMVSICGLSPGTLIVRVLCPVVLFALYGATVNRITRLIGFRAIFVAATWLPVEYVLGHSAHFGDILVFTQTGSPLLAKVGSLFGLLMISFVVVLINSLFLITSRRLVESARSPIGVHVENHPRIRPPLDEPMVERWNHGPLAARAPPVLPFLR